MVQDASLATDARYIVENLRSGVPSPRVARRFPMGREEWLGRARAEIEGIASRGAGGWVIQANYGEGKTHLLHAIWGLAHELHCAVSFVVLSKETALDRPDRLYAKLVATLTVPGSMQPGLDHLLEVFLPGSREAEDLLDWAQDELHPKVWAVLFNRIKGQRISEEQTSFLDQDLMGAFIPMQELKAIHRLNFRNSLRMESRFRLKDHAFDYYRLVERMIVLAGYRGWVILIDEAELIGRLGIGGRAASYAQLGRLLGATGELNRTFTVVGVASTFLAEVLSGRRDREQAPQWLRDRGRLEEAKLAEFALERLADAELLRSLNRTQLQQAIEIILAAHQEAYRWSADIAGERLLKLVEDATPGEDVKLRTRIRAAIQILDMLFQYGRVPQLVLQRLVEEDYREQNDE